MTEPAGRSVRDSRQFCSLCYFHFWRPTRVFHLGRFDDLIPDPSRIGNDRARFTAPRPESTVLLGDNYFIAFGPEHNGLVWHLMQRRELDGNRQCVRPWMEPESTKSGWPVFPICWDCFWVTKEFLVYRSQHTPTKMAITSLDALYAAIHAQWRRTDDERNDERWALQWPHKSYRGPFVAYDRWERTAPTTLYPEEKTSESVDKWRWLVDNPYRPLPSLPDFLLSHLRPASDSDDSDDSDATDESASTDCRPPPSSGPSSSTTRDTATSANLTIATAAAAAAAAISASSQHQPSQSRATPPLERLPNELLCQMVSYLDHASVFALRLTSRHLAQCVALDQNFWYQHLVTNRLFGFFFDFDSMKVMEETRSKCQKRGKLPPHWDWKRLVGELARFESFQNGGVMADAPGAFRNRRRIWKILEVAERTHRPEMAPAGEILKAKAKAMATSAPSMEAPRAIKA